ncbi:hypothetical protein [Cellulomonas xylanilytica]|uniref:Uncharacterized protein n=1 Tax=Cellulomonas xylanilytica TaxID=233583 RepID=A0A510V450_9CELL|nr:hypothetical protein [Cellulomonas xylanilytica]GEK19895.1 hypothetical protein CXY01_04150 [Cellulomonas xylanilytica]
MTAIPESPLETLDDLCWCCGGTFAQDALWHLGAHPEVAVCAGCARYLSRRATEAADRRQASAAGRGRAVVRRVRAFVVQRGWHERRVIGPVLSWIDRFLP